MGILAVVGVLAVAAGTATVWRIGHDVPPRDLIAVARATHSPRACLGFVRFCARHE